MRSVLTKVLLYILIPITLLVGCSSFSKEKGTKNWIEGKGKLKVLCTTAMIEDITKRIGGEYIDCHTLIHGGLDPHSYELVKGDGEKLEFAHAVIANGLGLEHGASLSYALHSREQVLFIGDEIEKKSPELIIYIDGQADPHIWTDVSIWKKASCEIATFLSTLDPQHASYYAAQLSVLDKQLTELDRQISKQLSLLPQDKRYLVSSHDAFHYFTRRYLATKEERQSMAWKDRVCAPEGLAPDAQMSMQDIGEIVHYLCLHHIPIVFPESNVNKDALCRIVELCETQGVHVGVCEEELFADSMGDPQIGSYVEMMEHNARVITSRLGYEGK